MTQSFAKYTCIIMTLVLTTTSASHATFSLFSHKKHETKLSIIKHIPKPPVKHNPIALLPEYCPPTTPTVPHTPPTVPHTPPTTPPTSVSEPISLAATIAAMSAFLYRRRNKA